jgi:DNA-binding protein WhiA
MSFSEECKIELWEEEPPKKPCCRRAMALGLLFCADASGGLFRLTVPQVLGEKIASFLEKQLNVRVSVTNFCHVGRQYAALELISRAVYAQFQRADMSDLPLSRLLGFDCDTCTRYFLSGVLIASGTITDPAKGLHMEFTCHDSGTARRLSELLSEAASASPKSVRRKNGLHLYYKNSAAMEDLFSYLHAHKTLFALINQKIEREIRNDENRATNCVARNIQKAVMAAAEQRIAIELLQQSREWDRLSAPLRETAELRLANPEATLAELALLHCPPITKSGLNHRLKKLAELSSEASQNT